MRAWKALAALGFGAALLVALGADNGAVVIGVVDIDHALNSTEEGKQAREEIARKMREAEAKVQPMTDRYKELSEEIKSKRFVLSEEALFQKQLDLAELQNQIESKIKELEGELKVDQTRIEGPLVKKLGQIVEDIGKDDGYTLILRRDTPGVMYSREALDITDRVIEKFNEKG